MIGQLYVTNLAWSQNNQEVVVYVKRELWIKSLKRLEKPKAFILLSSIPQWNIFDHNTYPENIVSRGRNMEKSVAVLFFLIMVFIYWIFPYQIFNEATKNTQNDKHLRRMLKFLRWSLSLFWSFWEQ